MLFEKMKIKRGRKWSTFKKELMKTDQLIENSSELNKAFTVCFQFFGKISVSRFLQRTL